MELKDNEFSIRAELNGREYYLVCDRASPLGELHDVLCMMKNHVIEIMKNSDKPQDPEPVDKKSEE